MDRRDFLRLLLATPLATPLLSVPREKEAGSALYLIADDPQNYLPEIIIAMENLRLTRGRHFSFRGPHPFAGELRAALVRTGWELADTQAPSALTLSLQLLRQPVHPSFTLLKSGRVMDLRAGELGTLWREMNRLSSPSACLTVAHFSEPPSFLSPGRSAAVFFDGKKQDTLSLKRPRVQSYRTLRGEVAVRVRDGKAEVLASSCRHRICQSAPPAFLTGERIVCAPNHFLLAIEGSRFVDTVTG